MLKAYTENDLSVSERSKLAWSAVCFVRLWKAWIELSGQSVESSFISLQTYNDVVIAGHSLILLTKVFFKYFPNQQFHPKMFGSDSCERLYSRLRGFFRGKSNLCMLDVLDICSRILKLDELKFKKVPFTPSTSWPDCTKQETVNGIKEAEKEVRKTIEQLGMLPLLTAGNILRKDKEGEIIYLNRGKESKVTEMRFEPDELESITVEE